MTDISKGADDLLAEAASYLRAAITLLDEAQAPAHIAAHVDLAVNQIQDMMAVPSDASRAGKDERSERCAG